MIILGWADPGNQNRIKDRFNKGVAKTIKLFKDSTFKARFVDPGKTGWNQLTNAQQQAGKVSCILCLDIS
jgi:hypothetical protein